MEAVKMENLDLKADSKFDADGSGIELDEVPVAASGDVDQMTAQVMYSANHRNLNARQIRFTSFAGAIGAVLFVAIGSGVPNGPLPMLLGTLNQLVSLFERMNLTDSVHLLGYRHLLHRTVS